MITKKPNVVISLSGGMDSSTLLLRALAEYENVTAISFDYGQKHRVELERAQSLVDYLNENPSRIFHHDHIPGGYEELYPEITYKVVKLEGLAELLASTLVIGGGEVPEGHYVKENMKDTVVPNRNKIFSSITQAVALSIANTTGESCDIALGIHAGDHCFTKNTKILTPEGLKTVEELKEGSVIYSFNLETNTLEEDIVTAIVKKNIAETIQRVTTLAGNLEVTDEHKVYRLKLENFNSVHGYEKSIEKIPAKELQKGDWMIQPTGLTKKDLKFDYDLKPVIERILQKYPSAPSLKEEEGMLWLGRGSVHKGKALLRKGQLAGVLDMVAWYIAEGYSQKDPYVVQKGRSRFSASFSQSLSANLEKVELIRETVLEHELPVSLEFSKVLHNGIPREVTVYTSNILAAILKECGSHSKIKHIPDWVYEILLNSAELRERFIYILGIADGYNTEKVNKGFCSISPQLIEQVITLIQLSGYHYTVNPPTDKRVTYTVQYQRRGVKSAAISLGGAKFTRITELEKVQYGDHVYDITVQNNHNFFAGEYGSVLISNSIYPDCRQEFRDADDHAFRIGNWDSEKVSYWTPYLNGNKLSILKDGEALCKELGLNFNQVYRRTNTSYKPYPSGNSDYKSASSVERIEAFMQLGRPDPVTYEDETGVVTWGTVVKHVTKVLNSHE